MKKPIIVIVFLFGLFSFPIDVFAQKHLTRIESDLLSFSFVYDEDGRMEKAICHDKADCFGVNVEDDFSFEYPRIYSEDVLCINLGWRQRGIFLKDGYASYEQSVDFETFSSGAPVNYTYDDQWQMNRIAYAFSNSEGPDTMDICLQWKDGNVETIQIQQGNKPAGSVSYTYCDTLAKGEYQMFSTPTLLMTSYFYMIPFSLINDGYYGKQCQNLIERVDVNLDEEFIGRHNDYFDDCRYLPFVLYTSRQFSYDLDGDGYVTKVTEQTDDGTTREWTLTYGSTECIRLVDSQPQSGIRSLYDLQGRRLQGKPERGLYIQDGVKRVVR